MPKFWQSLELPPLKLQGRQLPVADEAGEGA